MKKGRTEVKIFIAGLLLLLAALTCPPWEGVPLSIESLLPFFFLLLFLLLQEEKEDGAGQQPRLA